MQVDIHRSNMLAYAQRIDRLNLFAAASQLVLDTFVSISAYLQRKGFF